jgi:hypothetical protein
VKSGSNWEFTVSGTPKSESPSSVKIERYTLSCDEGVSMREGDDCWRWVLDMSGEILSIGGCSGTNPRNISECPVSEPESGDGWE